MKKFAIVSAFFLLAAFIPSLVAQEQEQEPEAYATATFQGELVSVDTTAQTLVVRDSEGTKMEFAYNEQTRVSGADQEIAGLATRNGSMVTVSYTEESGSRIALQIHVEK